MMTEVYHFGRFTLDPAEHRLRADGASVPLGSRAFGVLLALVERAGAVVTKDDLISRAWGYTDVEDNRLYVHINALRKIVGKECIVNKQGRGYRFEAQVQRSGRVSDKPGGRPAGNLPVLWTAPEGATRLIGRDDQLRALKQLLARVQLVTLTGPGGVGKTRLAVRTAGESAANFPDGVWLVELAALNEPDLVAGAVATAIGVKIGQSAAPLDTLARQLARKSLLIVLDNCEHLVSAAALLSEALLRGAPGVKILATSREALSCIGEQVFELSPLEFPREAVTAPETLRGMAAVELFIERAMSAHSNFGIDDEDVSIAARMCRRVDGLPLAIEMVAGWAGVLGLKALDAEFESPAQEWLRAGSTAPTRHATLRATLEWSHDLLSPAEQMVLRRLAVFASGFTVRAAKAVVADDQIPQDRIFEHVGSLIRKSMLAMVRGSREQRYRLLETTRAFMLEKLAASSDCEAARRRHADWMLGLLETAMREWETTGDAAWLERYAPVLDDLRSALDWTMSRDTDEAVALAGASWLLWRNLALLGEGQRRLREAATRLHPATSAPREARLRHGLGVLCVNTSAFKLAHDELTSAVALYRKLGESPQRSSALADLGYASVVFGRIEEAEQAVAEALTLLDHTQWPRTLARAHYVRLFIELRRGRYDAVRSAGEKALRLCELAGADFMGLGVSANLVEAALEMGDIDGAVSAGRSLAARLRATTNTDALGFVLGLLAGALTARGDLDEALVVAREADPLLRDHGMLFWLFDHLALRAGLAGHTTDAALIAGYADAIYRVSGRPREPAGCHAVERLAALLRAGLSDEEIGQLKLAGGQLTENQAITLALGG